MLFMNKNGIVLCLIPNTIPVVLPRDKCVSWRHLLSYVFYLIGFHIIYLAVFNSCLASCETLHKHENDTYVKTMKGISEKAMSPSNNIHYGAEPAIGILKNITQFHPIHNGTKQNNTNQCLVMEMEQISSICNSTNQTVIMNATRTHVLGQYAQYHLKFCDLFIYNATFGPRLSENASNCVSSLEEIIKIDYNVEQKFSQFSELYPKLTPVSKHVRCGSVQCNPCMKAYRNWLCSAALAEYLSPCSSFCEDVERECPYMLPSPDDQYAGEPSFFCNDNEIDEPVSEREKCLRFPQDHETDQLYLRQMLMTGDCAIKTEHNLPLPLNQCSSSLPVLWIQRQKQIHTLLFMTFMPVILCSLLQFTLNSVYSGPS